MKVFYVIGMPGTGKTTLMRSLLERIGGDWKQERVIDLLDTHVCYPYRVLGKYEEGETFSGTDRLSMAVAPKAIEWIKTKPDEIIFGEGDRLNNKGFFEACGDSLTIIHLTVPDSVRQERYLARGSEQSEKFIQTTKTKCQNILDAFGDRQTLFGEEKGCVVEFEHATEKDTVNIVNWILEEIKKIGKK